METSSASIFRFFNSIWHFGFTSSKVILQKSMPSRMASIQTALAKKTSSRIIVSWFASDPAHAQQAYRGFVLLWSKSGAKRSRQLGLATVCQLFIQSLSRPELHVPRYHEPSSPVFSPLSFLARPIRTVGSIVNSSP